MPADSPDLPHSHFLGNRGAQPPGGQIYANYSKFLGMDESIWHPTAPADDPVLLFTHLEKADLETKFSKRPYLNTHAAGCADWHRSDG